MKRNIFAGFPVSHSPVFSLPSTARIGDLYVAASHRRRHIGRELVDAFVAAARASGRPRIEVGTLTRDPRAVAFWRALGFEDWQVTLERR